jgi:CBS domain-containing protein
MSDEATRANEGVRPLADLNVEGFASAGIVACAPDARLATVAWLMANNRVHAIVVVDDESAEPPVIADADVISAAASGHFDELRAIDIAGKSAISVSSDETLARAAELLAEHRASHLVVRDQRRAPIGILSTLDIARALGTRSGR